MLQLQLLQLEQHVRVELENNPMLEEAPEYEPQSAGEDRVTGDTEGPAESTAYDAPPPGTESMGTEPRHESIEAASEFDPKDAFEFYKLNIT